MVAADGPAGCAVKSEKPPLYLGIREVALRDFFLVSRMSNLKEIEEWQGWGALGTLETLPIGIREEKSWGVLSARSALGGARGFRRGAP